MSHDRIIVLTRELQSLRADKAALMAMLERARDTLHTREDDVHYERGSGPCPASWPSIDAIDAVLAKCGVKAEGAAPEADDPALCVECGERMELYGYQADRHVLRTRCPACGAWAEVTFAAPTKREWQSFRLVVRDPSDFCVVISKQEEKADGD